jgi:hypothetical protein
LGSPVGVLHVILGDLEGLRVHVDRDVSLRAHEPNHQSFISMGIVKEITFQKLE